MNPFKVNDVIKFTHQNKKYIGIVTFISGDSFVECIDKTGKTFQNVYVGYAENLNKTIDIAHFLDYSFGKIK